MNTAPSTSPFGRLAGFYCAVTRLLDRLQPLLLLGFRLYVAQVFVMSGLTKIQNWSNTVALFTDEYHVPLLPPVVAAALGTATELSMPVLLVLGLASRFASGVLFVLNIVAVVSYYATLVETGGVRDHVLWGTMLIVLTVSGPGKIAIDTWLERRFTGRAADPAPGSLSPAQRGASCAPTCKIGLSWATTNGRSPRWPPNRPCRRSSTGVLRSSSAWRWRSPSAQRWCSSVSFSTRFVLLASWDVGALCYLGLGWLVISRADATLTRLRAQRYDPSGYTIFLLVLIAASTSFVAIGFMVGDIKDLPFWPRAERLTLSVAALLLSWLLIHTLFAFHYARMYYFLPEGGEEHHRGLKFPDEDDEPDYLDFAYYSFVVGMTSQVSDVAVLSRRMRRLTLIHGVLSFIYNIAILAMSINIIGGVI